MQIEDITSALNKYLEDKRKLEKLDIKGHFVVKRNIKTMKPPIYKKFIIELYYITPVQEQRIISVISLIHKCASGTEDIHWKELSKLFLLNVFDTLRSETFNKLIYGNID